MFSSPKDLRHHNPVRRSLSRYSSSVSTLKIQVTVGCHTNYLWKTPRFAAGQLTGTPTPPTKMHTPPHPEPTSRARDSIARTRNVSHNPPRLESDDS